MPWAHYRLAAVSGLEGPSRFNKPKEKCTGYSETDLGLEQALQDRKCQLLIESITDALVGRSTELILKQPFRVCVETQIPVVNYPAPIQKTILTNYSAYSGHQVNVTKRSVFANGFSPSHDLRIHRWDLFNACRAPR